MFFNILEKIIEVYNNILKIFLIFIYFISFCRFLNNFMLFEKLYFIFYFQEVCLGFQKLKKYCFVYMNT